MILIFTDILPKDIGRIRMKDASNQTIESQPICKDDHDQRMHILLENFIKDKSCLSEFEMSLGLFRVETERQKHRSRALKFSI